MNGLKNDSGMHSFMLIGITGNFASGKSTFLRFMKDYGLEVFDADKFVDSLYRREEVKNIIKKSFGERIFSQGAVDKKALATIVFDDNEKLSVLNSIIHPIVSEELKRIDHKEKLVFAEIPLLFETGMEKLFDQIVVVSCPENVAVERAKKRGFSEVDFHKRMSFQLPDTKKKADFIVDSNCSIEELRKQAELISKELLKINAKGKK